MTLIRLKGFEKLTNVDEALSTFFKELKPRRLDAERVRTEDALGRVVAENVIAPNDLPSFDRSAVDGYAVRADDTFEASQFRPKTLTLTESNRLSKGQAKQIWTGNALPQDANAVVMLEHVRHARRGIQTIVAVTPYENVSKRGEDVHKGEAAVAVGTRLLPHHVGLCAALGLTHLNVVRKPVVAFLATGNELVELGKGPRAGQIVNSNRFVMIDMCRELGAETHYLGIARDDEKEIAEKITDGISEADMIITTGGTSVGVADLVPTVINKLGKPGILVHGLALRPGMPTAIGILRGKPAFVLSGNPVAAIFGFEVFVRPTILRLLGVEAEPRPVLKGKLMRRVAGALGRRVYLRVRVINKAGEFYADPVGVKGSGLYSSMTKANGYAIIPEDREGLEEGETVMVFLFGPIVS